MVVLAFLAGAAPLAYVLFVRAPAPPAVGLGSNARASTGPASSIGSRPSAAAAQPGCRQRRRDVDDRPLGQPTSFLVLSIEDHGTMELQLHFRRG